MHALQAFGKLSLHIRLKEESILTILNHLGDTTTTRADNRLSEGESFSNHHTQRFIQGRRHYHHIHFRIEFSLRHSAHKLYTLICDIQMQV